jgi:hypothetical protein
MKKKIRSAPPRKRQRNLDVVDPVVTISVQFSPRRLADALEGPEATPGLLMLATMLNESLARRVAASRGKRPNPKPEGQPN